MDGSAEALVTSEPEAALTTFTAYCGPSYAERLDR